MNYLLKSALLACALSAATAVQAKTQKQFTSDNGNGTFSNPLIYADVPDLDVIRVGKAYYMVSTTMHLSPGAPIMKSYDLVNWKTVNYVYNQLDSADRYALKNGQNDYASGSWASSLKYDKYEKRFYNTFSCNSTGKSYIFSTKDIEKGPWHRTVMAKCYDAGLLFDDNGKECKKYIIHANDDLNKHEVSIHSLTFDASHNVTLGKPTVIIPYGNVENPGRGLRAEGIHAYKIGKYYYLCMIQGEGAQRQEICWRSASLKPGSFEVKKIFAGNIIDENGREFIPFTGVAQGGLVETKDGKWYAPLFQDYGSVGRIPVLIPVKWVDGWPVLGNNGKTVDKTMAKPVNGYEMENLIVNDEFNNGDARRYYADNENKVAMAGISVAQLQQTKPEDMAARVAQNEYDYNGSNLDVAWQWNHNPNNNLWSLTDRPGYMRFKSGIISSDIQCARNTLTQRTYGPVCSANVAVEVNGMRDGDVAGLSAFQNQYGFVGVRMIAGKKCIVMRRALYKGDARGEVIESLPLNQDRVYLKVDFDFRDKTDKAYFYYSLDNTTWTRIGDSVQMAYDWPHFVGYRFGLFYYSTEQTGGYADFDYFHADKSISEVL